MDDFKYYDKEHHYYLNGIRLKSITEILNDQGFLCDEYFTEESCIRGKAVHLACRYLVMGRLDWDSLKKEYRPYVEAFQLFLEEKKPKPILDLVEKPQYSKIFLFGGTPDIPCECSPGIEIYEIKTGDGLLFARLQTGAQKILLEERTGRTVEKRWRLKLNNTGKYGLDLLKDRNDVKYFLSALCLSNLKG